MWFPPPPIHKRKPEPDVVDISWLLAAPRPILAKGGPLVRGQETIANSAAGSVLFQALGLTKPAKVERSKILPPKVSSQAAAPSNVAAYLSTVISKPAPRPNPEPEHVPLETDGHWAYPAPEGPAARVPEREKAILAESTAHIELFQSKLDANGRLALREKDMNAYGRWKALGCFLLSCPNVHTLRLEGMNIQKPDVVELGKGALKGIRHITFCGNNIGINKDCLEYLIGVLLCGDLKSATIDRNSLSDMHMPALVDLVERCDSLSRLSLCWNSFGDIGAIELARGLRKINAYDVAVYKRFNIDLSYNCIGAVGKNELNLSAVLASSRHQVHINLKKNFPPPRPLARRCHLRSAVT